MKGKDERGYKTTKAYRGPNYTIEEDNYILANYANMTQREIGEALGRDIKSIQHRAERLGIKKKKCKRWTKEEDEFIKSSYRKLKLTEVSIALNRDYTETCARAKKLGINNWRRDESSKLYDHRGYEVVSFKNNEKPIMKHRAVMEEAIGRELNSDEIVHHIDTNAKNNELSNLFLCSKSKHASCHWSLKNCLREGESVESLIRDGTIQFDRKQGLYFRTDGGVDK